MKKTFKRISAVAGVTVLGVATLAGCTQKSSKASSMFGVMSDACELEKYTYEITSSAKGVDSDEKMDISIFGECDGTAMTMGMKFNIEGEEYNLEDLFILTEDTVWINVDTVCTFAEEMIGESYDLTEYGIDKDWISIECENNFADMKVDDDIYDALDKAYDDLITEKDGKFVMEISDEESFQDFIDATTNLIEDNGDKWAEDMAEAYSSVDFEKIVKDMIYDVIVNINTTLDAGLTDDDIDAYVEEAMAEVGFSEMEIDAADIQEMFDEMLTELEASKEAELGESEMKVTAYQEKDSYVTKAEFVSYEDGEEIEIETSIVITKDNSVKVELPTENSMTLSDAICAFIQKAGMEGLTDSFSDAAFGE